MPTKGRQSLPIIQPLIKAGTTFVKLLCANEAPKYFLKNLCGVIVDKCNR